MFLCSVGDTYDSDRFTYLYCICICGSAMLMYTIISLQPYAIFCVCIGLGMCRHMREIVRIKIIYAEIKI